MCSEDSPHLPSAESFCHTLPLLLNVLCPWCLPSYLWGMSSRGFWESVHGNTLVWILLSESHSILPARLISLVGDWFQVGSNFLSELQRNSSTALLLVLPCKICSYFNSRSFVGNLSFSPTLCVCGISLCPPSSGGSVAGLTPWAAPPRTAAARARSRARAAADHSSAVDPRSPAGRPAPGPCGSVTRLLSWALVRTRFCLCPPSVYGSYEVYKVMLKILQARLHSTWSKNFQMYKLDLERKRNQRSNC